METSELVLEIKQMKITAALLQENSEKDNILPTKISYNKH